MTVVPDKGGAVKVVLVPLGSPKVPPALLLHTMVKGAPGPVIVALTFTVSPPATASGMFDVIFGRLSIPVSRIVLPYIRPTAVFCASPSA